VSVTVEFFWRKSGLRLGAERKPAALLLMGLSGAAALGWQWVWTSQLGVVLGHEALAVLATMAAFFAGLALGALTLGQAIERSARPQHWYAGCEAMMALWGLTLCLAGPRLMAYGAAVIGPEPSALWHWSVAFLLPGLLLLPATAAMGATLPALERMLRAELGGPQPHDPAAGAQGLSALYAANTLGAVTGVLLAVFWALPQWGVLRTGLGCAAINAGCALLAWGLWRHALPLVPTPEPFPDPVREPTRAADAPLPRLGMAGLLFGSGLLGIGYEVLAVRVLSQVTENTVYSQAVLLAVYLLGTAAGAALYPRWQAFFIRLDQGTSDASSLSRWLACLALAVAAGGASLWWAQALCAWPAQQWGTAPWTALAGEALAAALAMGGPTLVMGGLFTHLCLRAQARGWALGPALALNTLGAALAPLLIGVVVVPAVGACVTLALLVAGYALLQLLQLMHPPHRWRHASAWAPALAAAVLALWAPPLRFITQSPGATLVSYRDGVMAAVSVVQDAQGVSRLRINNRAQEGSSASGWLEWRLAQLPLLLHASGAGRGVDPLPVLERRALFLGLGTGFTAAAAASDARVQVDAVELLPEVIAAADFFARAPGAPQAATPVRWLAADARRFVQAGETRYDVIVADLFHPARNGAGTLYTVEQFAAVRARLATGGVFCQWLALHQMELGTLRSIVAAFLQVYPDGVAVLASNSLDTPVLGLLARPDAPRFAAQAPLLPLTEDGAAALQQARLRARLNDDFGLLGSLLAGPTALHRFAQGAPINTDDRPQVVHGAPWDTYAPQTTPRQRLLGLVQALQPQASDLLTDPASPAAQRLQSYWAARQSYLALGMQVQADSDLVQTLNTLQAPLLALLDQSPDFTPARDALNAMAGGLAQRDPERTEQLRAALQARPVPLRP
jgi:spermidine synthase